jgi:hypothetical protein
LGNEDKQRYLKAWEGGADLEKWEIQLLRGCLRSKKALIGYSLSIDKPTGNESNATILPY